MTMSIIPRKTEGRKKYRVTYDLGNPDYVTPTTHQAETWAASPQKAINNVWFRCGRDASFYLKNVMEAD